MDPLLAQHLQHFGIDFSSLQKVSCWELDGSTVLLQLSLTMRYPHINNLHALLVILFTTWILSHNFANSVEQGFCFVLAKMCLLIVKIFLLIF